MDAQFAPKSKEKVEKGLRILVQSLRSFLNGCVELENAVAKELATLENHCNQFVICSRVDASSVELCGQQPDLKPLLMMQIKLRLEEALQRILAHYKLFLSNKADKLLHDCCQLRGIALSHYDSNKTLDPKMLRDWTAEIEIDVVRFEEQITDAFKAIKSSLPNVTKGARTEFKWMSKKFGLRYTHSSRLSWLLIVLQNLSDDGSW